VAARRRIEPYWYAIGLVWLALTALFVTHLLTGFTPARAAVSLFGFAIYWYAICILVGVGLGHPIPQARFRDLQIFGQLGDRFGLLTGELDGSPAELGRVWGRHRDILPGGRSHLRAGVRPTGGSSGLSGPTCDSPGRFCQVWVAPPDRRRRRRRQEET